MRKEIANYIELIIRIGINIQKDQILVVSAPVETFEFTRKVVEIAYKFGAKEVVINWVDEVCGKYRYLYGAEEIFDIYPKYQADMMKDYAEKGAAFLSIYATDPEILKDVDQERVARAQKARSIALKGYYEKAMNNEVQWCVVSIPTDAWSKKIYPDLQGEEAKEKLWNQILSIVRADSENPVEEWNKHLTNLKNTMNFLNSMKFRKLRYRNSLGTDLEIGLPKGHIWTAGGETSKDGVYFVANMPTEEVFTLPKKDEVNGIAYSSKPFCYGGNLIENFYLKFENGRVVEAGAEKGEETLIKLLDSDSGSRYLGEVALVPYDSPISNSKTVFYNTLFDENASCHLALGQAYPVCLEGGSEMNEDELKKNGVNISMVHEDFMVGTSDLEIVGITEDGEEILIMKDGNFCK